MLMLQKHNLILYLYRLSGAPCHVSNNASWRPTPAGPTLWSTTSTLAGCGQTWPDLMRTSTLTAVHSPPSTPRSCRHRRRCAASTCGTITGQLTGSMVPFLPGCEASGFYSPGIDQYKLPFFRSNVMFNSTYLKWVYLFEYEYVYVSTFLLKMKGIVSVAFPAILFIQSIMFVTFLYRG